MSPHTTTTKPAPADSRTSRTLSACPVGAPSTRSVENEYCVFATQTGRRPYPSFSIRGNRRRAFASQVTSAAPYIRVATVSTFSESGDRRRR